MFNKVNGTAEVYRILKEESYVIWKFRSLHQKERDDYLHQAKALFNFNLCRPINLAL